MKNKRKIAAALMLALCTALMPANAYAAEAAAFNEAIQPYYVLITSANSNVGTDGTISASITAVSTAKKCTMDATLQKYSGGKWSDVKSWSVTEEGDSVSIRKTNSLSAGTYRLVCDVTVYKFDRKEDVTIISPETVIK